MLSTLRLIEASTSGNTQYVMDELVRHVGKRQPDVTVERQRAELAKPADLLRGDVVILGSGTWNTGGTEGQLNPVMHAFLNDRAKNADLSGHLMTFVSLGDDRYYYRTRCIEHFLRFLREHGGTLFIPPLILVNEPYGQEEKIARWADKLLDRMAQGDPVRIRAAAMPRP